MSTGSRSALSSLNSIQYPEKLKVRFDTISTASTIRWWFLFFFNVVEYIPSSCLSSIYCVHLGVYAHFRFYFKSFSSLHNPEKPDEWQFQSHFLILFVFFEGRSRKERHLFRSLNQLFPWYRYRNFSFFSTTFFYLFQSAFDKNKVKQGELFDNAGWCFRSCSASQRRFRVIIIFRNEFTSSHGHWRVIIVSCFSFSLLQNVIDHQTDWGFRDVASLVSVGDSASGYFAWRTAWCSHPWNRLGTYGSHQLFSRFARYVLS